LDSIPSTSKNKTNKQEREDMKNQIENFKPENTITKMKILVDGVSRKMEKKKEENQ
jgi:hypothetical protein